MDSPRGVSSDHVLSWAFGDAYCRRENVRHATLLFSAVGGCATESRETAKGKYKMYCTKCGNQVDDSAAFCTKCGAPMNGKQSAANEAVLPAYDAGGPRRPKIPGVTLTACIILYVAFGLSIIGILSGGDAELDEVVGFVVVFELFAIACTVLTQIGRNWARIVLTVILGLSLITNLGNVGIFILMCAFFVPPLVLLWLPRSNNWYRAIKSRNK